MVKAQFILKYLLSNRKLKSVCNRLKISYKYVYSIAKAFQNPSMNIQKGLLPIIHASYWHEEADDQFMAKCKEELKLTKNIEIS